MFVTAIVAASLVQALAQGPVKSPDGPGMPVGPVISGEYAELQASGVSGCNTAGIPRTIDLRILAEPPHDRSANIGEMAYWLGHAPAQQGGFTVAGQPERTGQADGSAQITLGGGRLHTAGRHVDGISDGQLTGHVRVTLTLTPQGHLLLRELVETDRRGADPRVLVSHGTLADGARLRAFARCVR